MVLSAGTEVKQNREEREGGRTRGVMCGTVTEQTTVIVTTGREREREREGAVMFINHHQRTLHWECVGRLANIKNHNAVPLLSNLSG